MKKRDVRPMAMLGAFSLFLNDKEKKMEYTFDNIPEIINNDSIKGYSCVIEEKPLPILQKVFDDMKKVYIRARNYHKMSPS